MQQKYIKNFLHKYRVGHFNLLLKFNLKPRIVHITEIYAYQLFFFIKKYF